MIVKTVKVSDKGQIALPLEMREEAGISKGEDLLLIEDEGKILIEKVAAKEDEFRDMLAMTEMSLKDLWENKEDDIWNTYLK